MDKGESGEKKKLVKRKIGDVMIEWEKEEYI